MPGGGIMPELFGVWRWQGIQCCCIGETMMFGYRGREIEEYGIDDKETHRGGMVDIDCNVPPVRVGGGEEEVAAAAAVRTTWSQVCIFVFLFFVVVFYLFPLLFVFACWDVCSDRQTPLCAQHHLIVILVKPPEAMSGGKKN